jgi:hypothetical protein
MFEELICCDARLEAVGHEVVALVAQHTDQFGGQRFIEQAQNLFPIGAVAFGYGAILDVLASAFSQGLYIRQMHIAHLDLLEVNPRWGYLGVSDEHVESFMQFYNRRA